MKATLKSQWDEYTAKLYPQGMSDIQRTELNKAFYTGAFCTLEMVANFSDQSEYDAVKCLHNLKAEIITLLASHAHNIKLRN